METGLVSTPSVIARNGTGYEMLTFNDQTTPNGVANVELAIQEQIAMARNDTNQLHSLIDRIKAKVRDAELFQMSKGVPSLRNGGVNLTSHVTLNGHNNKISDFSWSLDSRSILSASQDGFMIIWDAASGFKKNAIPLDSQWVLTCAISPTGNLVASGGLTNNCTVYRVSQENRVQQQIVSIFKGHTCYVSQVEFLDNEKIVTASGDMTCALWDIPKAKRVSEFSDHLGDVLSLALAPEASHRYRQVFVSGGSDGYAHVWDTRTRSAVQSFFVSDSDVSTIKFFNNGDAIITGTDDGIARMFDLRSDCLVAKYSLSQGLHQQVSTPTQQYGAASMEYAISPVTNASLTKAARSANSTYLNNQGLVSLDFSGSGRLMHACYTDYGCVTWDTLKAEIVGKLEGHSSRISGVKTSPDGLAVCTGSWDATLKLWSPAYV
ncbi:LADA_0C07888g1_1 [Lachancea dasiensis]|uniref:LADA_0C07888g1_1 n=1 Tax=Lachancea dasiensis TaxID=1072105 RepID=A0A1G4J010_9SACH|nr:LADA_0C07888g1_1 [Lachancea dasiensis]